jgi:ribosomal protein S18 acetylase RimI-like enzyme
MKDTIRVREMRADEAQTVSDLARRVFDAFVGHEFTGEGVASYAEYVDARALQERQASEHFTLVAFIEDQLAGMIEFRHNRHLSMLFVDPSFHRKGVARRLYDAALERLLCGDPALDEITVNASRYAVPVYEKLGFTATGEERTVNGIIFVPMAASVVSGGDRRAQD